MPDQQSPTPAFVRDLMTVGIETCGPDTPIVYLARRILEVNAEAIVVQNSNKHALGVVTQDELVQAYSSGGWEDLKAEEIMRVNVPQIPPDIPLKAAAQLMRDQNLRVAYITHHAGGVEYPAALLTYRHFIRHLAMEEEADLKDLGIKAEREAPIDTFIKRRDEARKKNRPANKLQPD